MVGAGILTALALVLLVNGLDAWAARRVTRPARQAQTGPGAAPPRRRSTASRPAGTLTVTALIPACNEELHLPATLISLQRQTRPPTAVWVIADNCTDATAEVARGQRGRASTTTVDNHHRKAGGLNQMLARLLPTMGPLDVVLVMDADTIMVDDFLERAVAELEALPGARRGRRRVLRRRRRRDCWATCSATSTGATPGTSPAARGGSSCSPGRRRCSGPMR